MKYAYAASVALYALMSADLHAQVTPQAGAAGGSTPAQAAAQPGGGNVQDIVVTAQKRSQRLQDVPMSIQAIGAAQITQRGVDSLVRLTSISPGVAIAKFSNQRPALYIRGIGTRQLGPGSDQSVGVFVDDFYAGDSSALFTTLTDIDRIEVLKGPQGTLYGRNTIAGAINIVTKEPTAQTHISADLSLGSYKMIGGNGSLSGALAGDTLTGRLSFYSQKREGYMLNTNTGGRGMGIDQSGLRGELVFRPTDRLKIKVTGDYNRDTSPGQFGKNQGPLILLRNTTLPLPAIDPDPYHQADNLDPTTDATNYGINSRIEYKTEPFTIAALTQYRHGQFHNLQDVDSSAFSVINRQENQTGYNVSQELRVTSDPTGSMSLSGHLDWIIGAFYYHQNTRSDDIYNYGRDSFPVQLAGGVPVNNELISKVRVNSAAAYGEATLHITDSLGVTGGLRYSHDAKDGREIGLTDHPGIPLVSVPFDIPVKLRSHSLDPKISVNWKPVRNVLAYASFSKGYKSGGFQYLSTSAALAGRVFEPERVKYYEAGLKTQWFDRRLTANVAVFKGDYNGLQLQRIFGSSVFTDNAANVKLRGVEVETHTTLSNRLSIDLSYTYLDNKFGSYNQCQTVVSPNCAILDGTRLPRSPKNQLIAGAQYVLPLGDQRDLTFRADWTYRSKSLDEAGGFGAFLPSTNSYVATLNPLYVEPSNSVIDLRLTYHRDRWSLAGWVTNASNATYAVATAAYLPVPTALGDIGSTFVRYYSPPRMYGMTLSFRM